MNVFDWLSNMDMPVVDKFDIAEVRFKNGRKEFFRNINGVELTTGDAVVVDVPNGHHIGHVSLQGELVRLQMQKKKIRNDDNIRAVYRIATQKDLEKYQELQNKEMPIMYRTREIIRELNLQMKLTDVEYQADGTKATFYYSAEDRVDFRQLIKVLASEFRLRVEMRQISLRQEAGRLGGIGSCGRELCCATWLSDFKSVSTTAARYQNLSLNPSKLSGQCGRLKCCLNYELETYMEALEDIPAVNQPLITERGEAYLQKTDIFRKMMWFGFGGDDQWHPVPASRVQHILEMNTKGLTPATLLEDKLPELDEGPKVLNQDLALMDKRFEKKAATTKKKRRKKPKPKKGDDTRS
ncbi:PSP1 domain-containing protein [Cesiribacter andamanensis]|uniref:PSP1 C-terminal domain-containing protein n=1 Tax=Cesiribacter andamanensis AMV16 TaxID=1279009 RepID=M7NAU0_9BACT|nr:regulatory iron-sulfur-containing complex subunit RicT [Cesiribacter andamanensis]EMR04281.1 hypothetical protein ADICEAN_00567 [Cesiribacter andamanensis AMV16]